MNKEILKQRIIFRRIIQGLVILAIFLMAIAQINHENDLFWQLKMGEEIVERHHFPIKDPFSLPAQGAVWTLEEWIPGVLFYLLFKNFGPASLIILKAIVISTTFFIFMVLFNKMKVNLYLGVFVLALAAMVNTRGIWAVFPSIFEYLFLVLTLFLLEKYRKSKSRKIPIFLAIFSLIWANSHASFFLLTAIVASYLFGDMLAVWLKKHWPAYQPEGERFDSRQKRSLFLLMIASIVSPFLTPNGYWTFLYPFRITFGKFTSYVSEYQRFWVVWNWNWQDFVHGFTLILLVILALIFLSALKRLHLRDFFLATLFSVLALTAVRHVAIFSLVALFLIARYLTVWFGEYRGIFKRSLLKDILVIILIVCFIFFYKTKIVPFGLKLSEEGYPKEAAELINASGIPGNIFNHYNYGGYLIWKMPGYKVFIDGRLEMYQGQVGEDYLTILQVQEGYKELLEKYKINFFISYLIDPIIEVLTDDPEWKYVFHDSQYVVFVKNTKENEAFIKKELPPEKEKAFKEAFKEALARFKAEYLNNRGLEFIRKKDVIAAMADFQEAIGYKPDYLVARFNLVRAYMEFGLFTEAEKEYQAILEIDPNNEMAKKNLEKLTNLGVLQEGL